MAPEQAHQHEHESVGRDELLTNGEDDLSGIEAKDDAALLVSRSNCAIDEISY
jgi:hypothetical protein